MQEREEAERKHAEQEARRRADMHRLFLRNHHERGTSCVMMRQAVGRALRDVSELSGHFPPLRCAEAPRGDRGPGGCPDR